jgi:hypothetical protein
MTKHLWLLCLFAASSAFADTNNNEQIANACKPYLQQYAGNAMPAAAAPALTACYNTPNICNTAALSGMTDCVRKLNTWEFSRPVMLKQPPALPTAKPIANPEPFTEGTPSAPAQPAQPAVKPYNYYSNSRNSDAASTTPKQTDQKQAPQKNNQKGSTGINWF